jgi:hypothetical protein
MTDAKPSYQRQDSVSDSSNAYSSQPDELEALRAETDRLRKLVVQLSKMAIKNAVNAK